MQIIREALSNATRHAEARNCRIRLDRVAGEVQVEIDDDGRGLAGSSPERGHYGLAIMRERALTLGGALQIEEGQPQGTRIRLAFRPRGLDGGD